MTCPNCGSMMRQGPAGGWACGNCGTVRLCPPTVPAAVPTSDGGAGAAAACGPARR
ncbi:transcription initiation factor IIB family protein [Peterkaempfera bronchialis]|uniref:hypothetical protein n=1 Tax=Peterkaempfera bronchialis TaxID=2126346 RepID=UPI0013B43AD9|nr:hypothetical protein [Peterkaempfera bronchialis]